MYTKPSKSKILIRRFTVYTLMVLFVVTLVSIITFFMLGYSLKDGKIEQSSFLQFNSNPSGATVTVDGRVVNSKTPNKITIEAGKHQISMWRDGYKTWSKTIKSTPGILIWLNYVILVPNKLSVESVTKYDSIYSSSTSHKSNYMLIQKGQDKPLFELVDFSSDKIKNNPLSIPASVYSQSNTLGVTHQFSIDSWDDAERYVLIKHTYGEKSEWLVLDTQGDGKSNNISRTFDIDVNKIVFSGNSGNNFFVLEATNVRKLDLSAKTISSPLIGGVITFNLYSNSKIITYVGNSETSPDEKVVGVYKDGDDKSSVIRSVKSEKATNLQIATARYFNSDYIAISNGKHVDILSGNYPNITSDNANSLRNFTSFDLEKDIDKLSFSPSGEYVFMQSGSSIASYDLEYLKLSPSNINNVGTNPNFKWLDGTHLWSDVGGKLTIREFDGQNVNEINTFEPGQDVAYTNNGKYIYSIGKIKTGYQLQRVRMILP